MSDKICGVSAFTSAIGFGYRTDKGLTEPKSWKDLADPKLAGVRASYIIPVNSLGQMHLMMLGKIYGKGLTDLDAAYKALEQLKPIKMYDFTGGMEKALLSAEVNLGVLHDSGIYRYDGQNQPIAFAAPSEGVLSLEQVWNITPGTKMRSSPTPTSISSSARRSRSRCAKPSGIRPRIKRLNLRPSTTPNSTTRRRRSPSSSRSTGNGTMSVRMTSTLASPAF